MKIEGQLENLRQLGLPPDQYIVVSSGALAVRQIREAADLDVVVTEDLSEKLINKYKVQLNEWGVERIDVGNDIEILNPSQSLFGGSKLVPLEEMMSEADLINGIKFINLKHLRIVKEQLGREIDMKDIQLIDDYLASQ